MHFILKDCGRILLILAVMLVATAITTPIHAADDPLQLIAGDRYDHYAGEDVPGFKWDIYIKDYFNDEWRMKKVRESGSFEYFVGNRYVPINGKRYAFSASIYHSSLGDVLSFVSQSWQNEKALVYNMVWQNNIRMVGCEYWLGADRFDGYYFRSGYQDLISGTFGGHTVNAASRKNMPEDDQKGGDVVGVPASVWQQEDEAALKQRLEPERFEAVMKAREEAGIK